jgi:hypothetical protein
MNAQAEQLKAYVEDLRLVVGSGEAGRVRPTFGRRNKILAKAGRNKTVLPVKDRSMGTKALSSHRSTGIHRDQVAPLEGDFNDF